MFFVLMSEDSTRVDSLPTTYEIPEIIEFSFDRDNANSLSSLLKTGKPKFHDVSLSRILSASGLYINDFGYGQLSIPIFPGSGYPNDVFSVNNHPVYNMVSSFSDCSLFPPFFFETVCVRSALYNGGDINLTTKCNTYDRPYSAIRYSTGSFSTSIYDIDFTRAITNNFGFYLNGLYTTTQGHLAQSSDLGAVYTQIYTSKTFPLRFDGFYVLKDYISVSSEDDTLPVDKKKTFADATLISGNQHHRIAFRYTSHTFNESASHFLTEYDNTNSCYGIDIASKYRVSGYDVTFNVSGEYNTLSSNVYGDIESPRIHADCLLDKCFDRVYVTLSGNGEYHSPQAFFFSPYLGIGTRFLDSTNAALSVSRGYRTPAVSETLLVDARFEHRHPVLAQPNLRPEYSWLQQFTLQHKESCISLYKYDYTNLITIDTDEDTSVYTNVASSQTIGIDGCIKFVLRLQSNAANTAKSTLSFLCGGNYALAGDQYPLHPQRNGYCSLEFRRDTERFATGIACIGEYVGSKTDINGQYLDDIAVLSATATIRFVTLSFALRINNILDDIYYLTSDYPLPRRNIMFTVRWEFFN
jgi:outer membrane receptor protein involved in Fe transport